MSSLNEKFCQAFPSWMFWSGSETCAGPVEEKTKPKRAPPQDQNRKGSPTTPTTPLSMMGVCVCVFENRERSQTAPWTHINNLKPFWQNGKKRKGWTPIEKEGGCEGGYKKPKMIPSGHGNPSGRRSTPSQDEKVTTRVSVVADRAGSQKKDDAGSRGSGNCIPILAMEAAAATACKY